VKVTTIPLYQIDAFADAPFTGDPAAVCPLDNWLPDQRMQAIAAGSGMGTFPIFKKIGMSPFSRTSTRTSTGSSRTRKRLSTYFEFQQW
jgi:hypothetical protein